jgi:hypothetical protein
MTLPVSPNSISLSQIATEFSGNASLNSGDYPLELNEYYGQDAAPTTGAISFSNFHGGDGVPSSGLQYHYDGQISETTIAAGGVEDISVNDRTGTLTNGAAFSSANLGKIVFDGTNDYVQVTGYKGVTGKTARTSIIFVKLDAATPATQARALSWGGVAGNGQKWAMEFTTSGNFSVGASGGSRQSNFQFTLNQWRMFAATIPTGGAGTPGVGQQNYTTAGTNNFTVPAGVYSISAVVIGGGGGGSGADGGRGETNGGGGGGALSYATSIAVTPGETLTVVVGAGGASPSRNNGTAGGTTTISRGATVLLSGGGGAGGRERNSGTAVGGISGGTARTGGGSGGAGGTGQSASGGTGGGGAGGYSGNGGAGGARTSAGSAAPTGGGGGGGGGFSGTTANIAGGGGGVGILGSGASGSGGTSNGGGGQGGSSGGNGGGNTSGIGGTYGGGGGGRADNRGAGGAGRGGAVRMIWGTGRSYPSTGVADATTVTGTNTTGLLSDVTLYYNATRLTNYTTGSIEVNTASSADVSWGASLADSAVGPIDGEIAKVLIYNRELSHAEITQIYNAKAVALGLAQLSATTEGSGSPIDPTYSVAASTTSVNEGSSVTFTITTTNIPNGTTLFWSTLRISGTINANDFTGGQLTGSFTITSNSGSVVRGIATNADTGTDSFQLQIRTVSTAGTVVATSATVTINN